MGMKAHKSLLLIKGIKPKANSMLAFDTARAADDKPSAETNPEKQRHHSPMEVSVRAADDKPSAETTPEKQRHHSPTEVSVESAGLEAETKAAPEDAPRTAKPKPIAKPSTMHASNELGLGSLLSSDSDEPSDDDATHSGGNMSLLNTFGSSEDTGGSGGLNLGALVSSSDEESRDGSD